MDNFKDFKDFKEENKEIYQSNVEDVIAFTDAVSKTLEGIKDRFFGSDGEKNLTVFLESIVLQTNQVIKEKFEEIIKIEYSEDIFNHCLSLWIDNYSLNKEFILNIKVLFKNLKYMRSTIKTKITASDNLSNISLLNS